MLDIIHALIKETINEYIYHKIITVPCLDEFIYHLINSLETSFFVVELDSLLSIQLFPYYLSEIKDFDLIQFMNNIPNDDKTIMHQHISQSDYFDTVNIDDPYYFLGSYYIYYVHEYTDIIKPKLLTLLHTYQFHL